MNIYLRIILDYLTFVIVYSKILLLRYPPDRPFHNFLTSKSGDRLVYVFVSRDGFWSSKVDKGSVGKIAPEKRFQNVEKGLIYQILVFG